MFSKSVFIQNSCLLTITCHYHMFIVVCMLIASSLLLAPTAPPALPVSPCATLALPLWVSGSLLFCMVCAYRSSGAFQEFVCATNMQPGCFTEGFEVFESLVVSVFPWLHACFSVLFFWWWWIVFVSVYSCAAQKGRNGLSSILLVATLQSSLGLVTRRKKKLLSFSPLPPPSSASWNS